MAGSAEQKKQTVNFRVFISNLEVREGRGGGRQREREREERERERATFLFVSLTNANDGNTCVLNVFKPTCLFRLRGTAVSEAIILMQFEMIAFLY